MGELLLRMVFSLAVVVGLLILISRLAARRLHGRAGSPIEVLHRQPLSKSASVSVVSVAGRVLVLGTTDQQVSVLTELDPAALTIGATEPAAEVAALPSPVEQASRPQPADTEALPSLEALLAEPDHVTLEELFGHRPPTHAEPAPTPQATAAAYAGAAHQPAAVPADHEDPYLPEDPSYAAFAAALRAQLAEGARDEPVPAPRSGRHAAPAPAMELPPTLSGGARAARAEAAPAPPPPGTPPSASAPSAADLATLRAALLSAQLQASAPAGAAPAKVAAPPAPPAWRAGVATGPLGGSVLSPQTWRQAYRAVTRRAS